GSLAASIGMSAAGWSATLGLVLVYIFFMFIEQSTFQKKIAAVFPDKKRSKKINFIVKSIAANMKKYMFMKTAVSVATALLSYAWMKYFGLEFAGVWAFIIFILNYIPTFGTIIATSLPIIYAMLVAPMLVIPIAAGLITVQLVLSNLLEPRLTGQTLNLSTLAILINLVFWGMLWGPVGMFFSVPLLVATFVITSQFDRTRWIAVLLSSNGQIPEKKG
ncbi:MAG: AI-2E family transporter, partial [Alphaproteobacteria bacterium]|nr:AI-2E family transporter [Alphaproteobacteria bacterium]